MEKRTKYECDKNITVSIKELMAMLSLGAATSRRIGELSGASVKFGKRKVYIVKKIEAYMEKIAEEQHGKLPGDS